VSKPTQIESLDALMRRARDYAHFAMHKMGQVRPTLFASTPEGLLMFTPESMTDASAKENFANTARLICAAYGAMAAVLALEAWATFAKPGEPLDETEAPSEAFDRRELVVLMGESSHERQQQFLPIIRTDAGTFFGFDEMTSPEFDQMKGRFSQILPPRPPSPEHRKMAKAVLSVMGVRLTASRCNN
jgi:hypothetical protein